MGVVRQRRLCYTAADGFGGFGKTGKMRIGGVYILSRRSIARMLATITAALAMLYATTTAQAEGMVRRIHDLPRLARPSDGWSPHAHRRP